MVPSSSKRNEGLANPTLRSDLNVRSHGVPVLVVFVLLLSGIPLGVSLDPDPRIISELEVAGDSCADAVSTRTYDVVAIDIKVVYNNFGDHDPDGRLFVLAQNEQALRDQVAADPDRPAELAQPLVIRAHLGECVVINLENKLPNGEDTGLQINGLVTPAGQGMHLGENADDTIAPGETRQYSAFIPSDPAFEGGHFLASPDRFQVRHGMFGAIVAQPPGVTWTSPGGETPFDSGQAAIIVDPNGPDHREYVLIYQDEIGEGPEGLRDIDGNQMPQVSEFGEYGPGTKGINLRSEPFRTRFLVSLEETGTFLKSQGYGSYSHGDPGIFIPEAYVGDPTKFRLMNSGPGQHHVHHLHGGGDRWRLSPVSDVTQFDAVSKNGNNPIKDNPIVRSQSERIDVQTIGPGESYNAFIEGGAGGVQSSVGDFLFHCHIVEHYLAGMWSFWRVYNTFQDHLAELPDRAGLMFEGVNSVDLLGSDAATTYGLTADNIDEWVESQLPAQGVRNDRFDAAVWDWTVQQTPDGPLYLGEPETEHVWANYPADHPGRLPTGERPELRFNQDNGRLEWPFWRPQLGDRPPFAPGHGPAPYLDGERVPDPVQDVDHLCPPDTAPEKRRTYNVVALQTPVRYNDNDLHEEGKIFVHAEDKQDVIAGNKDATSFVIRANEGDCVDIVFSSQLKSSDASSSDHGDPPPGEGSKVNMHIHLVQFDVQASDGVITGMAYEQSVRPAAETGTDLAAPASPGDTTISVSDATGLHAGSMVGVGLTEANVEIRRIVAIDGNTLTLDEALEQSHSSGERVGPEFVRYRWFADVELGLIYWHDHVDGLNSWRSGLFASIVIEPDGSRWCAPDRETEGVCEEDVLDGHVVDIVNEDPDLQSEPTFTFREYVAQVQENGGPDAEWASINLRSGPFSQRSNGNPLSSAGNGDPATQLWQAYPGDAMKVRLLYGGQGEEDIDCDGFCLDASRGVSTFAVTGHRFAEEQFNPGSRLIDRVSFGISDMKNLHIECAGGGRVTLSQECARLPGDYLYGLTTPDFFQRGGWGILRVHDSLQDCSTGGEPDPPDPPEAKVWVNEFDQDPADSRRQWVELWNAGPDTVDLNGWKLRSVNDQGTLSLDGSIAPGEFKVFDDRRWMSKSDESIQLEDDQGVLVDQTPFLSNSHEDDRSWQRTPDGGDEWEFRTNTKGESNGDGTGGPGESSCLQPLPSNTDITPGNLPTGPVREYEVAALEATIEFNEDAEIDETRHLFALEEDAQAILGGQLNPEPLVLRALPGETVRITLRNDLDKKVSFHQSMLICDPNEGYGIPVGENAADAIEVPAGETRTFDCYADAPGTGWIRSFGDGTLPEGGKDDDRDDTRRSNSLYGAIIVEPVGSSFSPATGTTSTVSVDGVDWTEQVLLYENEDNTFHSSVMPYTEFPFEVNAVNYRTEPLTERDRRLDPDEPMDLGLFSSALHGDPETPIINVAQGDNLVVRSIGGAGDQFNVHVLTGHIWKRDPDMAGSNLVSFATLGPGQTSEAWIPDVGQGGPGDYLYGNQRLGLMHGGGQWGIIRVGE